MASHIAHLECDPRRRPGGDRGRRRAADHVTGLMGLYTEIGVVNRRDASPDAIINEIRSPRPPGTPRCSPTRRPTRAPSPTVIFGGVGWDWRTLLRNRPLDVWMHEQDVRRAVDRPGGMDSAAARHTAEYLAESLGYVLAKRVGAPAGHDRGARDGGQRAVRVHRQRRGPRRAAGRRTGRPDAAAADGPRGVHPAGRRPVRRRARHRRGRRRPGARRSGSSTRWRPPRDGADSPGPSPTSPTRPAARSWSPARPSAGSGTTPRSSWPGAAPGSCSPAAAASGSTRPSRPIRRRGPGTPRSRPCELDLADLSSVRRAAAEVAGLGPIDVLVNNAGVMGTPYHRTGRRARAADGDQPLRAVPADRAAAAAAGRERRTARVVTVSSQMHRIARKAPLDDPHVQQGRYQRWPTYGAVQARQPALHLRARPAARRAELPVKALAAHPGFASTHLAANGQYGRSAGGAASILDGAIKVVSPEHAPTRAPGRR